MKLYDVIEKQYGIPQGMLSRMASAESGGTSDPDNAISSAGAIGRFQFRPGTAKELNVNPRDTISAADGAARYLKQLYDKTGDWRLAAAAYNAGPNNPAILEGRIPQNGETDRYVDKVMPQQPQAQRLRLSDIGAYNPNQDPQQAEQPELPKRSEAEQWQHAAGVAGRAALEGVASVPGMFAEIAGLPLSLAGVSKFGDADTSKFGRMAADAIGLPTPNAEQQPIYNVGKAAYSAMTPGIAAGAAGAVPNMLKWFGADAPFKTAIAAASGQGASEATKAYGGGEAAQIGAGILGNIAGGGVAGAVPRVAEGVRRTGQAAFGNLDQTAGRVLNRMAAGLGQDEAAALAERQMVEGLLSRGVVEGVDIPGFNPRSSAIAGNAGISRVAQFAREAPGAATDIAKNDFMNAEALRNYAQKAVGTDAYRAAKDQNLWNMVDDVARPMRDRNAPVELEAVRKTIDDALNRHAGNPAIENALNAVKAKIPEDGAGFNTVLNYKQWIDDALRGKYADPESQQVAKAGAALGQLKTALADALDTAEPGFKDYIKTQAVGLNKLKRRELADEVIQGATQKTPIVYNDPQLGQREVFPLAPTGLQGKLTKADIRDKLSPAQLDYLDTVNKGLLSGTRRSAGRAEGSNTFQNFKFNNALEDDILRGVMGGDLSAKSPTRYLGILGHLGHLSGRTDDLAAVLARAELDPKYAAELMRKAPLSFGKNPRAVFARGLLQPSFTFQGFSGYGE